MTRLLVAVWAACFAVYLGAAAVADRPTTGEEPHHLRLALSLLLDGDTDLANDVASPARSQDVADVASFAPHGGDYRGDGTIRSAHPPGTAVVLLPAVAVARGLDVAIPTVARVEMAAIAATAATLLLVLVRRWTGGERRWAPWLSWAAVALAVPLLPYATQLYPEVPALTAVLAAVVAIGAPASWRTTASVGVAAAVLPWLHHRYLPIAIGLVAAQAIVLLRRELRRAIVLVAPVVVSLAVMGVLHQRWYGDPAPAAASDGTALTERTFRASGLWYEGLGTYLSASGGWFPFAPAAALGLCAAVAVASRRRDPKVLAVAAGVGVFAVVVGATSVPGDALPARFAVVVVPAAAYGLSRLVATGGRLRDTTEVLIALSVGIGLLSPLAGTDLYDDPGRNRTPVADAASGAFPTLVWDDLDGPVGSTVAPGDAPSQTGRPATLGDTPVRVAEEGVDEPGLLAFGPYLRVVPARWRVTYPVSVDDPGGSEAACIDATVDDGRAVLASRCLAGGAGGGLRDEVLEVTTGWDQVLEARVLWNGEGSVTLGAISIAPVEDLRPDRGWPYVVAWLAGLAAGTAYLIGRRLG